MTPLPGPVSYWQVRCEFTPTPEVVNGVTLCEIGAASPKTLDSCTGYQWISGVDEPALTLLLYRLYGTIMADICHSSRVLKALEVTDYEPKGQLEYTVGFLLNKTQKCCHIIDVGRKQVLFECQVSLSGDALAVVRVLPQANSGAVVSVFFQSGQQLKLCPELVSLLQSLAD